MMIHLLKILGETNRARAMPQAAPAGRATPRAGSRLGHSATIRIARSGAWVGRAAWNYGSFYLWGDLPALMPHTANAVKVPSFRFDGSGRSFQSESVRRTDVWNGARFTNRDCGVEGRKRPGIKFSEEGFNCTLAKQLAPTLKRGAVKLSAEDKRQHLSSARKAASAMIAKIPLALSSHIARVYKPARLAA